MNTDKANQVTFPKHMDMLKAEAYAHDFSTPINCSDSHSALCEYFHYYGFDEASLSNSAAYRIGVLNYKSLRLVAHWWKVEGSSASIFLAHGLFDHIGLYLKIIQFLVREGFSVFAVDMPGHGLSEGPLAEIDDFSEYAEVLELSLNVVLQAKANQKLLMLGQSTGGSAIAHYLMTGKSKSRIEKAVLLAPLLRPQGWQMVNISWLLLHKFIKQVPRRFAENSNDKYFLDFLANKDPLQPLTISIRWLGAMRKWVKCFPKYASCDTPVLIIQGDADGTVDWQYNIPVFQKQFPNNKTVMLANAKHHLVNETANFMNSYQQEILTFLK